MGFPKELIEVIIDGIEFAEEETLTDYAKNNISQEDPITSRLATRIQDETNRIIKRSYYNNIWRCDAIELSNKGQNSLEKEYGFDFAISIKDGGFIKTLIIQNKMEDKTIRNLENQIKNMSKISSTDKGYVGVIASDGIYLTSGIEVEKNRFRLDQIPAKDMVRFPELFRLFLECKVGKVGLDLDKLYLTSSKLKIPKQKSSDKPILIQFINESNEDF